MFNKFFISMPSQKKMTNLGRRGASAVEFAVVAPIFFLMLGGVIEFGQAFRIQHTLANACRRGARSAILAGATNSQVGSNVTNQCTQMLGVKATDVAVNFAVNGVSNADLSQAQKGDQINVSVSIPYSKAGVGFFSKTFSSATLSATSIFEHE